MWIFFYFCTSREARHWLYVLCVDSAWQPPHCNKRIRVSLLLVHWKDWCWSWNSNTLASWCEELTQWKRPWCWERLKAGGEGDTREWDGWMASLSQWTWVWVSSRSWWTGNSGVLQSVGLQRVGHDWATELNWSMSRVTRKQETMAIHISLSCFLWENVLLYIEVVHLEKTFIDMGSIHSF